MNYIVQEGFDGSIYFGESEDPNRDMEILQMGNPNKLYMIGTSNIDPIEPGEFREKFFSHHIRGFWFDSNPVFIKYIIDELEAERKLENE